MGKPKRELPKEILAALEDDEPIQRLRALRDKLDDELDNVDRETTAYLVPQLSSQLQACIRLIESIKDQLLERTPKVEQLRGLLDAAAGESDDRPATVRWADRVGAADAGPVSG